MNGRISQNVADGDIDQVHRVFDQDPGGQRKDGQRGHHPDHGRGPLFMGMNAGVAGLAQKDQGEQPHQVDQGQQGGKDGQSADDDVVGLDDALDDHELGEEASEGRHPHDGEDAHDEGHRGDGHGLDQPAHLGDVLGAGAVLDDPGRQEQSALAQPVHQDEQQGSGHPDGVEGRQPHEDVADLADGGQGQDPLYICFDQGRAGRDHGRYQAQDHQVGLPVAGDHEGVVEYPGEGIDSDLDQHRGVQQGGHRGGRHAGVRQPGVERQSGALGEDAHGDQSHRQSADGEAAHLQHVEGAGLGVDQGETQQHEHRSPGRHQEGLVGLDHHFLVAEEADQAPGADAGDLPEHVHQDHVGREHQAHHGAQKQNHHQKVFLLIVVILDITQRVDDDQGADQGRGDGHEDRQPVHHEGGIHSQSDGPLEDVGLAREGRRQKGNGKKSSGQPQNHRPGVTPWLGGQPYQRQGKGPDDRDQYRCQQREFPPHKNS